ncbi:urea transporter [Nitratiruptor sp. SB155-2]|uniref:urea transporter n=1 Tax=Nitratiruptor sp. (strain SB155-2) TaxID=387092 RepID=UPI00031FFC45|nr:urea transporter [Nitratiruptor sp. SB155-2]
MKQIIRLFPKSYISILFLREVKAGVILLLLSFLLPSVGFLGLVAIIATILFAELTGLREHYLKYGFYLYNSLLVGMGIGFYYEISILSIFLTSLLAILTFLLSFGLNRIFIHYALPILSLPFALVSLLFYLASLKYTTLLSNLLHRSPLIDVQLPFAPFFQSLGTIFFLPYSIAGAIIALIILYYSRILFFLAVSGYLFGIAVHSLFVPIPSAIHSLYNFNYILIAMAVGGVFLIPHIRSYLIAFTAVAASVVMIDAMEVFFNLYSLPVYTLPFNIITLLIILLTFGGGYIYFNHDIKGTPERSLEHFLSTLYRFGGKSRKIYLPFSGTWSVYQAFNDEWTHKGKWKYAYDFVIKKNGKTYRNDGHFLEDYYAYGASVLSPVNGYVVDIQNELPDNPIGSVDRLNNWGNYVIIRSLEGFYVEISHLMQHSIQVQIGEYVEAGDVIAKCGNSGYSPEPHIHIQVQEYPTLGSATLPFVFHEYIVNGKLFFYSLPNRGEEILAMPTDVSMKQRLTFILDEQFHYTVEKDGEKIDSFTITVKMNDKGEFYFEDEQLNRLYFYQTQRLFYFYNYEGKKSYLQLFFLLAPKIPFIRDNICYNDTLPLYLRYSPMKKMFAEFVIPFSYKLFFNRVEYCLKQLHIHSTFGMVQFSYYEKGFALLQSRSITIKKEPIEV